MTLRFGIFDHVDRGDLPLGEFYEARLRLAEAYDRAGFYGYHVAEHHSTPLGMAASPSVFLAAVAQRTRRLRLGPMVYTLSQYHPIRLLEEICMLDHMSGGRFDLGIGKGISPIEIAYYGVDPAEADRRFDEVLEILMKGFAAGVAGRTLSHEGEFFRFREVPLEFAPLQRPHPPLWYGVIKPDSAERAARRGFNFVSNASAGFMRQLVAHHRAAWRAPEDVSAPPLLGMNRFVVIAETDEVALARARRAYRRWWASFMALWQRHDRAPVNVNYPPEFDGQVADGRAIAGSPETVARALRQHVAESGTNYLVGRFAFGDLSLAESLETVDLFARHVMPALAEEAMVAAG
jgi:alkanesulfonate monooxygenase SsuD/methylene tetrahydromethanopterin reductase-like flavin-dependent oxidoreductase (luciferase family)